MSNFAPRGLRREPGDSVANRAPFGCSNGIGATEDDDMRPVEILDRLAECSTGKDMLEAERLERVEQYDIQIARQPAVLETVVEQHDVRMIFGDRSSCGCHAISILHVRNARQRLGEFQRFVILLTSRSAVAAAHNRHVEPVLLYSACEPFYNRGFAGAAEREIADANDGYIHAMCDSRSAVVAAITLLYDECVRPLDNAQQTPKCARP